MDLLVLISNSKLVPSKTTGLRPRPPDCPADVVLLQVPVEVAMEVLVLQTVEKLRISLKIVSTNPGKNEKKKIGKKLKISEKRRIKSKIWGKIEERKSPRKIPEKIK